MPDAKFDHSTVEVFMGGDFHLGQPKTVGELRRILREVDQELSGWGDGTEISEVWATKGQIRVTLSEGIVQ